MQNIQLFFDVFVLVVRVLILLQFFTGTGTGLGLVYRRGANLLCVTMSHTWIWVREAAIVTGLRSWPCFINFFNILLVSLVSVVLFRSFRFVVSGFNAICTYTP